VPALSLSALAQHGHRGGAELAVVTGAQRPGGAEHLLGQVGDDLGVLEQVQGVAAPLRVDPGQVFQALLDDVFTGDLPEAGQGAHVELHALTEGVGVVDLRHHTLAAEIRPQRPQGLQRLVAVRVVRHVPGQRLTDPLILDFAQDADFRGVPAPFLLDPLDEARREVGGVPAFRGLKRLTAQVVVRAFQGAVERLGDLRATFLIHRRLVGSQVAAGVRGQGSGLVGPEGRHGRVQQFLLGAPHPDQLAGLLLRATPLVGAETQFQHVLLGHRPQCLQPQEGPLPFARVVDLQGLHEQRDGRFVLEHPEHFQGEGAARVEEVLVSLGVPLEHRQLFLGGPDPQRLCDFIVMVLAEIVAHVFQHVQSLEFLGHRGALGVLGLLLLRGEPVHRGAVVNRVGVLQVVQVALQFGVFLGGLLLVRAGTDHQQDDGERGAAQQQDAAADQEQDQHHRALFRAFADGFARPTIAVGAGRAAGAGHHPAPRPGPRATRTRAAGHHAAPWAGVARRVVDVFFRVHHLGDRRRGGRDGERLLTGLAADLFPQHVVRQAVRR